MSTPGLTRRGFVKRGGALFVSLGITAGFSTSAAELNVQPEAITLIMGDTDKTPDGGYSSGYLTGAANLRKVGAYTYHALLGLAAAQLGVPVSELDVADGTVSGGGKSISYGRLVQGQQFDLKIPVSGKPAKVDPAESWGVSGLEGLVVTGDPPMKPMSE
jgi:nicotinate dehydrogenase subunit B